MPEIAILLATYNGQTFLNEQLASFASQTHTNWKIYISDDGSTDDTFRLLKEFDANYNNTCITIKNGPKKGFAANFLSMICDDDIHADYYAFSDQDDIWDNDKLERALKQLQTVPENIPALYCARTLLVDKNNKPIGFSPLYNKKPCFNNAIVQSIAGGNTMVMNKAARDVLCKASCNIDIKSHDWWAYIVITGCGGKFFYDTHCSLRYRQHSANLTGMNTSLSAKLYRVRMLFEGRFKNWNTQNIAMLLQSRGLLCTENQKILDQFIAARNNGLIPRLIGFLKIRIHRQTFTGNIALWLAAICGKV